MADARTLSVSATSPLARYRIMSANCGLRASPLQLGIMSLGEKWQGMLGSVSKEQAFELLDAFVEAGGNVVDTANLARTARSGLIIATKYTGNYKESALGKKEAILYGGNSRRSLHVSVRDSLAKLQTEWIDILYVHWWDYTTSIKEMMDSLHVLVEQGKVLYLGASDVPAWVVSAANQYAIDHGKTPFCIYQGRWSVMFRDMERDILPMCRQFGLALAPWGAIGSGRLMTKRQLEERLASGETIRARGQQAKDKQSDLEIKYSEVLAAVAAEHGIESVTAIALAWLLARAPNVFPVVGGRKVSHLQDNIQALKIKLTKEQIARIDAVQAFEIGFPHNMIGTDPSLDVIYDPKQSMIASDDIDHLPGPKPFGLA
ncbi:aryl-alcohol dehydrogenase [Rhodotorula toruloides]|uniref:Aryl-alcohol dehydrogenase n=1 Tax=Rhodotorula toruloides TaxID=5286 RepID=A0A511KF38_RHOTO|nr:aryl-alcohol dehydrogenase [Rhodotorula toruloides]